MLPVELLLAVGVSAACDWAAVATGRKKLEYVFKPLTMLLLVYAVAGSEAVSSVQGPVLWLCVALLSSLAGDVFLMLPRDLFLPGLVSFFFAHVAYIVTFAPDVELSAPWIVTAIVLVAIAARYGGRVLEGVAQSGSQQLRAPFVAYMVVITAMVLAASATGSNWAYVGAILFFASDTMIGQSRFVQPFRHDRLAIMITYHVGQVFLVIGALDLLA